MIVGLFKVFFVLNLICNFVRVKVCCNVVFGCMLIEKYIS